MEHTDFPAERSSPSCNKSVLLKKKRVNLCPASKFSTVHMLGFMITIEVSKRKQLFLVVCRRLLVWILQYSLSPFLPPGLWQP